MNIVTTFTGDGLLQLLPCDLAQIEEETVMAVVPFGIKKIEVVTGGLEAPGLFVPELGEDAWITIANAVVTVWIEQAEMRKEEEY